MHVFPLQYRELPGVNCVCRHHGGSPASSDSHQLNIAIVQNLCNSNYHWSGSLSSLKLGYKLASKIAYRSMLT